MAWFKRKEQKIDMTRLPKHIAFIADGNGRWANKRGLARTLGHKAGKDAIKKVLDRCIELKIEVVSMFCFSTENFGRPKQEVDYIFDLFRQVKDNLLKSLIDRNVKFRHIGDKKLLPEDLANDLAYMENATSSCTGSIFNLALAYGGRHEIIDAVKQMIYDGKSDIDEESFKNYLYTAGEPDPDLIVRASGEKRLSNFLLYQAAYAEFYFPDTYWPDFDAKTVDECIIEYQKRKRRYGKI